MKSKTSFIYFDLGGVVINISTMVADIAELSGKSTEELNNEIESINQQAVRGFATTKELWEHYENTLFKKKTQYKSYTDFCAERFSSIIETCEFIQQISKEYNVGILSNIEKGMFEMLLEKKLIPNSHYSAIVRSCDTGYAKPEKGIYDYAQKVANVSAEEIFFIDDRQANLDAAKQNKWQTFLFNSSNPIKSINKIRQILSTKQRF